jgi:hypothetical protein
MHPCVTMHIISFGIIRLLFESFLFKARGFRAINVPFARSGLYQAHRAHARMYQRRSLRKRVCNLSRFNAFQVSGACVSLARWRLIFIIFLNLENLTRAWNAWPARARAASRDLHALNRRPGKEGAEKFPPRTPDVRNTSQTRWWIRITIFCGLMWTWMWPRRKREAAGIACRGVLFVRSLHEENMNFNTNRVFLSLLPYREHSRIKQSVN